MGKKTRGAATDFSSFMCVILMLIGVLMLLLIINVLTIISNPENVTISAVIKGALYAEKMASDEDQGLMLVPKFGNKYKDPVYVDVFGDQIVIYPEQKIVPVVDLERSGNAFERLLNAVASKKDERYIVLLARPRSARVLRRLRTAIHDRQIDLGFELYEEGRTVEVAEALPAPEEVPEETPAAEGEPGAEPVEPAVAPEAPVAPAEEPAPAAPAVLPAPGPQE
ncbi:MAG TPA: hypothetical protein P5567_14935 [Kiritimatiellia bacterium]|nr:hypothetical protein [Kiritimatiellia bacterium]HSA19356.1 hypothetical protein [Kiritimatiellia bacterium]